MAVEFLLHWEKCALEELQNGDDDSDYVLTRYNRSSYYAMAVRELGRQVAQSVASIG